MRELRQNASYYLSRVARGEFIANSKNVSNVRLYLGTLALLKLIVAEAESGTLGAAG